ncbi:cobaltochelatase CobT-related protein [Enterovibrio baiacu]|uniref:cobaltochelatase CobT-related protein n=1 Tax=Enterovibrio baiacu TaxID=2491023 RepID=UPI0010108FF0|nr:aerobic cobaltochelatase CobT subunit [Enterovibrio baiacu]MBE1274568.1 aerobic cobaltochelatase CobT subunit [Enterovibrio baiacu]
MAETNASAFPRFSVLQQRMHMLSSAALRAEVGDGALHLKAGQVYRDTTFIPVSASHLQAQDLDSDFKAERGRIDAIASRLMLSDPVLHQSLSPEDSLARMLFDLLEQYRTEALSSATSHIGVQRNIRYRFDAWCALSKNAELVESRLGILLFTVIQMVRTRLFATPIDEDYEDLIEATRAGIAPMIGESLLGLRRCTSSQSDYAVHALKLAQTIADMIHQSQDEHDEESDAERVINTFALLLEDEAALSEDTAIASGKKSTAFEQHNGEYQVFTREFDTEVDASGLVRVAQLDAFRIQLDKQFQTLGINCRDIARKLARYLSQPQRDGWQFGEEEGYIDGRRLAQIVTSPMETRLFMKERYVTKPDSMVTLLIDCSGSMRQHIEHITLLVDGLVRSLGLAGIPSEVLGFTTNAWNGGKSHQQWMARGRPALPGRLNDVCHLVFKDADMHWRQGRKNIAALMKADLFREGIDGEAVEWACQRMQRVDVSRRVLLVLSDGCPMDTATNLMNDAFYLDNHLRSVVEQREKCGDIIMGLGIGLDLSRYYRNSLALDIAQPLHHRVFVDIVALMASSIKRASMR